MPIAPFDGRLPREDANRPALAALYVHEHLTGDNPRSFMDVLQSRIADGTIPLIIRERRGKVTPTYGYIIARIKTGFCPVQ